MIETLKKFGQCISYHIVEELETELANSIRSETSACPDGIVRQQNLSTCLAWENDDELSEFLSGADTVHDTVGIIY